MYAAEPSPRFQVTTTEGNQGRPDREWYYHFGEGGYGDIAYVDILLDDEAHRDRVRAVLREIHLPGEETDAGFRVFGYARHGQAVAYL